jgi:hypothetical protein
MTFPGTKAELRQIEMEKLRKQFTAYSKSKESRSSFCERLGMSKDKYYYWRKKLGIRTYRRKKNRNKKLSGFVPVQIKKSMPILQAATSSMHYELSLKDSAMLRIPADFRTDTLKTLLTTLQEVL